VTANDTDLQSHTRDGARKGVVRNYTKGARTATAFREAARRQFAEHGYLNTKVEDIAREAGRSPASFYNYFDSKADVLADIARDFHADTRRQISVPYRTGQSPREAVTEAITIFWSSYRDRLGTLSGVFQASMVDPEFLEQWRTIRADAIAFIARGVELAQADGYCPGVDPQLTASALSSMIEHFCYVWLVQGGDAIGSALDETRAIATLADIWFHAIYWRPEDGPAG
jgi:AcrR family transcriptional regulator